ncbi:MAG: energy-coupling factor transporter ATPase, partial [Clostridia bacterium]|nr:energy-coupling factor transporter ATPase [Clostridia bacterium]
YEEWSALPEYAALPKHTRKKALRREVERRRRELCFRVGLVMQYPEYQLFEETVEKDIAFGPRNMKLSEEEIGLRVREAAKFAGLDEELLQKSPFDLSGGQKRRVALAGVIAMRPEVLVLDEPAAGLDPAGRTRILDGILHYQRSTNSTVLIVSHSMEDMARYCDDVVVMGGARVLMHGERKEIFSHTRELTEAGLDIPQITHLMRLLRERGVSVPENIYTVEDAVSAVRALFAD